MENNDVLRRLRYALQLDDAQAARLTALGGEPTSVDAMSLYRLRSEDEQAVVCPDRVLGALLSGLVLDRRGPPDAAEAQDALEPSGAQSQSARDVEGRFACDNNTVLKRVKTALSMRGGDIVACIRAGGGEVSGSVVGSFLRRPGARNFRGLGDQVLRRFLTGLATTQRTSRDGEAENAEAENAGAQNDDTGGNNG